MTSRLACSAMKPIKSSAMGVPISSILIKSSQASPSRALAASMAATRLSMSEVFGERPGRGPPHLADAEGMDKARERNDAAIPQG